MWSKCPRNELHIFYISKAWNELHKQWKKRETSPKPLAPMDGRGNQRSSQMWWKNEQELPSPEPRIVRTSELNGSGREGGREGDKGAKEFCPGWSHQPGQKGSFGPSLCLQPGQMSLAPLSHSPSSHPSHSVHLFLLFLDRVRGVLAHLLTIFIKIFHSPVHLPTLKVWGLFLSSFIALVAHFML